MASLPKATALPTTERSEFTSEQTEVLKASPHVRKVTAKTVSYTTEFREYFWKQYNEGKTPPAILGEAGFDLDILGQQRIYGLLIILRREKQRELTDADKPNISEHQQSKPPVQTSPKLIYAGDVNQSDIRKLAHQVAFLTQEMDFLKKIIVADRSGKTK